MKKEEKLNMINAARGMERPVMSRPTIFRDKSKYHRSREKQLLRKGIY